MYCKQCGKEINGDVLFCPNCGTKLDENEAPIKTDTGESEAVTGFILGLVSLLFWVTIIVPILGLYFSSKGKTSSKANFAKAGKILSIISLFIPVLGLLFFLAIGGSSLATKIMAKNSAKNAYNPNISAEQYQGEKEETDYDWYKSVGVIQTTTCDETPATVRINVYLGYKKGDTATSTEITSRSVELKDFLRKYFRGKTAAELLNSNNEEKLKMEIRNGINDNVLSSSKIRDISFDQLDVIEPN